MTTPLRRRQMLRLGLAGLGTAVVGPVLWDRVQRSKQHRGWYFQKTF